jgi:EAL domain-containing protein (putative c-di-GMP-specific phosphodiesterase class I)
MASICWASISLLFLLAYPFANRLASPWLGLIALPYFVAMASHLRHCGYKAIDVFRIYGFNLILLPVNLAGVGNSIVQSMTGDKSVFGRTPKVQNRTVSNLLFVVSPYVLVGFAAYTLYNDLQTHRWDNFVYASLNSVLAAYAIVAYIGLRHSVHDTWVQLVARLYKPEAPKDRVMRDPAAIVADPAVADWASVLYFGSTNASPLVATMPMAAARGSALPVTLQRDVRVSLPASLGGGGVTVPNGAAGLDGATGEGHPSGSISNAAQAISSDISFRTVFQPIVALQGGRAVGYEALTRFDDGVGPAEWLAEAKARGAGVELETMLARAAMFSASRLPENSWVGLNVSSDFARARSALRSIIDVTTRTVVLEIDREVVTDPSIRQMLSELPEHAVLGISGADPNYESLALVRDLKPGVVKLDRAWVRQLHLDPARRALIRALVTVAEEGTCMLIAEGVESAVELEALRELGVGFGQGYLLGRPREAVVADPSARRRLDELEVV